MKRYSLPVTCSVLCSVAAAHALSAADKEIPEANPSPPNVLKTTRAFTRRSKPPAGSRLWTRRTNHSSRPSMHASGREILDRPDQHAHAGGQGRRRGAGVLLRPHHRVQEPGEQRTTFTVFFSARGTGADRGDGGGREAKVDQSADSRHRCGRLRGGKIDASGPWIVRACCL